MSSACFVDITYEIATPKFCKDTKICPCIVLSDLYFKLKEIGTPAFISPFHYLAECDDYHSTINAPHFHVMHYLGGRFSRASVLMKLHSAGIFPVNDYFEKIRNEVSIALYLVHKTDDSKFKQQFSCEPLVVCAPQGFYRKVVADDQYQAVVFDLIQDHAIIEERQLLRLVREFAPEYYQNTFRDLPKWSLMLQSYY